MNAPVKLQLLAEPNTLTAKRLRPFVHDHVLPSFRHWDAAESIPPEIWRELHALGLWQLGVPKAFGGHGGSTTELIAILRELAYGSAALATAITASFTASLSIFLGAKPALQRQYAERVLENGELSAFALTEQEGGSDLTNIQTVAQPVHGGYLLTGQKCFVTNATEARHFVVAARIEGERRTSRSLTLFYVPASAAGLTVCPPHHKLGQRAAKTHPIELDQVFVPAEHRLGEEGEALTLSFRALQRSRCTLAAGAVGLSLRACELARDYLASRSSLRKPLLSQPVIRGNLAQLHTKLEAAWELTAAAARDWDDRLVDLHRVNMAKLFAGQVANEVVDDVMQLFGGWGYTGAFEIEQLVRDVKFYEFVEGPAFVQQILIAKELFPPAPQSAAPAILSVA
jgi:alkylation response protein AidB-like acyl-CoA dehydrogenase